jgi:hypothetical protein
VKGRELAVAVLLGLVLGAGLTVSLVGRRGFRMVQLGAAVVSAYVPAYTPVSLNATPVRAVPTSGETANTPLSFSPTPSPIVASPTSAAVPSPTMAPPTATPTLIPLAVGGPKGTEL